MFLLIFESLGTSELILIGIIALIIFGPRKLPEMMKKFGKVMADFRRTTNEFKESWEREVAFEDSEGQKEIPRLNEKPIENSIQKDGYGLEEDVIIPEIKALSQDDFEKVLVKDNDDTNKTETAVTIDDSKESLSGKRDWL